MPNIRSLLGRRGENLAAGHLRKNGYRILERNFNTRFGEIDLVARDGETFVFIEVKTRRSLRCGSPGESITRRKSLHWRKAAQIYLLRNNLADVPVRFDFVGIDLSSGRPEISIVRDCPVSLP